MTSKLTPPLKWAGGKRWLVPTLEKIYTPERRLVDLFAGGLSVSLGLNPKRALVNDINEHLINFYHQIQNGLIVDIELRNEKEFYYNARVLFNERIKSGDQNSPLSAVLFYYLNRTGFNGLCRFNGSGTFNVPFGRFKTINYKADFLDYQNVLSNWTITQLDFEQVEIEANDFIYADPPYDTEFTSYSKENFKWEDQIRLANWLATQTCPVVVSNQATDRILELYEGLGFQIEIVLAPRRVNSNGDRTPAKEMLAFKNI
jgi:DNA adenine methylase